MSIDCSKNPKLEALEAKQSELDNLINGLASAGAAGMSALNEAANSMVSALQDMMPTIPEVPNFKKEIQALSGLTGEALVKAKADFKAKWGDALPDVDIDGMMANVSRPNIPSLNLNAPSFDLCKDVPNIDAPEIVDGKVTKVKDKGPEPTTPTGPPATANPVESTIVAKELQPSASGRTTRGIIEITDDYNEYKKEVLDLYNSYWTPEHRAHTKFVYKEKKKRDYKKLRKRMEKLGFQKNAEFYNSGEATEKEKKLLENIFANYGPTQKAYREAQLIKSLSGWYDQFRYSDTFEGDTVITHYARMKKHLFEYHVTDFSDGKYTVTKVTLSIEPLNEAILPIVEKWDKVLKERNTYLHGDRA